MRHAAVRAFALARRPRCIPATADMLHTSLKADISVFPLKASDGALLEAI